MSRGRAELFTPGRVEISEEVRARPIIRLRRAHPTRPEGRGALDAALTDLGCDVSLISEDALDLSTDGIVVLLGSANWYPTASRQLISAPREGRPPVILWHAEPLPFARAAGLRMERPHARELAKIVLRDPRATDPRTNYRALRRLLEHDLPDLLIASTLEKREFLAEQGIAAEFLPFGYHPSHGRDLGLERDIDALFLGALDVPRRKKILRDLRRAGVRAQAGGGWEDSAFWGENRTRLLNRTKILLNFPRHPGLLSGVRMVLGMANKALVVCEPIHLSAPYVEGVHYVSAPLAEMPEVIAHYLAHDAERERIAAEGHRFVTQELTMARSAATLLALVQARL